MYFGDINVKDSLDCILAHTMVINKKQLKVYAWYDNEIAYAKRVVDICELVSNSL